MQSYARGNTGLTVELFDDRSNLTALQGLVDASEEILLPPGRWPIHQTLNTGLGAAKIFRGYGVDRTTLVCTGGDGPTLGVAGANGLGELWNGGTGREPFDGFRLFGMTLEITVNADKENHCLFVNNFCDDIEIANVRFKGSSYEGMVIGGIIEGVWIHDVEAVDCGNGGPARDQAVAGLNPVSADTILEGFVCRGCGQGVESGQNEVIIRDGLVCEPGEGAPLIGINIGNNVYGIYHTTVEDCYIFGYENAMTIGNVLGRLARVNVDDIETDGLITFAGGAVDNTVPLDWEGPTTYGSSITNCTMRYEEINNGPIVYSSGIVDNGGIYGREPLIISGNDVTFDLASGTQSTAFVSMAGEISAEVLVTDNFFRGLDEAPSRGDVESFTNQTNPTIPNMPNLTVTDNFAFTETGLPRAIVVNRED